MKKLLIVFILLLGFMFMPNAYAAEIPREGVTYFLEYPDGSEDVKEDYDEAIAAAEEEKLIFTGQTDENGQVVLENIASEGTLRVVQEVPNGYSTDEREVIINLEESKKVEFRNTSGLLNPKTGFSILTILLVLGLVVGGTALTKKNKKALLVLPLLLLAGLVNVKADSDDLVIDVKDSLGRAQSGVTVKVYAKAKIEAAPAIKFDANGGHFFDGKTEMYVRIPSNGCDIDDLWDSLDENTSRYLSENLGGAYRNGYYIDSKSSNIPETLTNGAVINALWSQDSSVQLMTIHGNGGYYDFYGEKLNSIVIYKKVSSLPPGSLRGGITNEESPMLRPIAPGYMAMSFVNDGKYNIGIDATSSCNIYNQYGIIKDTDSYYDMLDGNDVYVCWHDKPDGIYVGDEAYVGNTDTCYYQSNPDVSSNSVNLRDKNGYFIIDIEYPYNNSNIAFLSMDYTQSEPTFKTINTFEIVENGNSIVSLTKTDLSIYISSDTGGGSAKSGEIEEKYYYISNSSKNNTYNNYMQNLIDSCIWRR